MPGCNKLYKCGSQKIRKQCTFVAGRLKTAVPKTLIYGIFVANVAKNTTYAFPGQNFKKTC